MFAGFYTSDLKRAAETAQAVADSIGVEPKPEPGLREIFLGDWEGLRTEEIAQRFPEAWASWSEEPDWDVVPKSEGAAPFEARVAATLNAIFDRHQSGDVLVVTHGGVIQVALHRAVGRQSSGLFPFKIENASISVVEKRDGRMIIGGVNDTAHLERARASESGPG